MTAKQRAAAKAERLRRRRRIRLRRESPLPTWKVKELGNGQLGIQCPRSGCAGKAKVNKKRWMESRPEYGTRSCTYCFVPAWLPEDML